MDKSVQGLDYVAVKVFNHMSGKFSICLFIFGNIVDLIFLKILGQNN